MDDSTLWKKGQADGNGNSSHEDFQRFLVFLVVIGLAAILAIRF